MQIMLRKLLIAVMLALCSGGFEEAHALDFVVFAKSMYPGSAHTGACTYKAPIRKCCTDYIATSCSESGCQTDSDCSGVASNPSCSVVGGDNGRRCCTDSSAVSCEVYAGSIGEKLCNVDGDCLGDADCTGINEPYLCCSGP